VLTNERFYSSKKKKSRVNVPFPLLSFFFFFFILFLKKLLFLVKRVGWELSFSGVERRVNVPSFFWGRMKVQTSTQRI
jgi:hypothetical protein